MPQVGPDRNASSYEDRYAAETPFMDPREYESQEEPPREAMEAEGPSGEWEVATPFLSSEWGETGEGEAPAPEIAAFAELTTELKDSEFREALEQLADEALELHADQLGGEYGDRELRDAAGERLLNDHFQPLAAQAEAMLDRLSEQLEGYEAAALTEMEIERIVGEVLPGNPMQSPASEQFLGGLARKALKLVSKSILAPLSIAGKGLQFATKIALAPFLPALKKLARHLLGWVAKRAIHKLPLRLQPLARKLSERLYRSLGETHEGEAEDHEQTETEMIPAELDVARLEAEFDLHAAQLLLTPDEAEADHLVDSYGEEVERGYESPLAALDRARAELADGLSRLQPGESAQPLMEQFLPAIAAVWPALKAAMALGGRRPILGVISRVLTKLMTPLVGSEAGRMLAPAMADVGLRLFGFETGQSDARAVATEALAATIEETVTRLGEMPPHVFENETLLDSAVREAFEDAAAGYFPGSMIKPELRETAEHNGMWRRMPEDSPRKRYSKYAGPPPEVTVTPRVAATVHTFDGNTLHDHLRDRMNVPPGRIVKTNVRLYQALPGTRASDIARAEGIPVHHLHPLTPNAAGALLGKNAGLGPPHATPAAYMASPHKLHVRQRLYYIEPPGGRKHVHHRHHVRLPHAELMVNLRSGEMRVWLYLGERLCQEISVELAKHNTAAAYRLVKPVAHRPARMLKAIILERHLVPALRIVSEVPNLDSLVPPWLVQVGRQFAAKIEEWVADQVAQYLRNNAEEFRRVSATQHDGVTLRISMSRIPGIETLRLVARGMPPKALEGSAWLKGTPAFSVHARAGYAIR